MYTVPHLYIIRAAWSLVAPSRLLILRSLVFSLQAREAISRGAVPSKRKGRGTIYFGSALFLRICTVPPSSSYAGTVFPSHLNFAVASLSISVIVAVPYAYARPIDGKLSYSFSTQTRPPESGFPIYNRLAGKGGARLFFAVDDALLPCKSHFPISPLKAVATRRLTDRNPHMQCPGCSWIFHFLQALAWFNYTKSVCVPLI